ncbi:hypothetical protein [Pseudarthrobacter sp. N5]|uniref:hypothetical protein n=1 Tax=Pseudarthrobacter sp. N5 TaxID=3418416 RepID=UPI003CF3BB34
MHIKEHWNLLCPATRQWFLDNPGCMMVPRTLAATINTATGENSDLDSHGQALLSEEDRLFIQAKAHQDISTTNPPADRFFDAARP